MVCMQRQDNPLEVIKKEETNDNDDNGAVSKALLV